MDRFLCLIRVLSILQNSYSVCLPHDLLSVTEIINSRRKEGIKKRGKDKAAYLNCSLEVLTKTG